MPPPTPTMLPLPTASRGYSAPERSPASTTAAGAIVPTVVEGMIAAAARQRERKRTNSLSLSLLSEFPVGNRKGR